MTNLINKRIMSGVTALAFCVAFGPTLAAAEEEITINSRDGVTVTFVVNEPEGQAKAMAILFTGGSGKLKLWKGNGTKSTNFLVRTRTLFAERGVLTLTVDVPSDRRRKGLNNFRGSDEHRADISAVVRWARSKTNAPVWLIGTSRGTVSLGHLSGTLPIDGAVFTASVTEESGRRPAMALDGDLEAITAPVLLVHHKADDCKVTPVWGVSKIADRLKKSSKVETILFTGGDPDRSDSCKALSKHGFIGIENKVVDRIVRWMTQTKGP
ncbi:MAG: alpha/beta hydrolase [Rhodospirillaceae bacterium]|nr:alpha/beta hydrolase [Rhodospirillaceae bacterium]